MRQTEVILIRHGETLWNAEGRQQGHLDSPLSERGVAQAQALAERLCAISFTTLYASDLGRAAQTAAIIGAASKHSVITDPRLRERHLGIFQTHTWPEIEAQYPEAYQAFHAGDPDYVIPEGESARQRYTRSTDALEALARRHFGETIAVVVHGGVLDGLFRKCLKIALEAPRRFKLWNASCNTFYYTEVDEWILGTWGDVGHLSELGTLDDA